MVIPATINNLPVTEIGLGAFAACSGLTSVTIPNSVTGIVQSAFLYCSGLTSVTIGNSVTSIGDQAFAGCSGLTSLTIPNSVKSIGTSAFYGCSGLTSVTIPNSVTSIHNNAFAACTGLTSVTIPNSVTSIGNYAFLGCTGLKSITVDVANSAYSSIDGILFNKAQTSLIAFPIGKIGAYTIPNSVTSIHNNAFAGCTALTSVTIGNSVTQIRHYAFAGCTGLKSITVNVANSAYSSIDGILFNKAQTSLIAFPIGKIGAYTIPNSVTSIRIRAFDGCSGLTSVTIPNSVTEIGIQAFNGCSGLTSVTIPNSVTEISAEAFSGCSGLTSVYFMGNAPTTGWSLFNNAPATIYYIEGTIGWSTTFMNRPTATFNPANAPTITVQPLPLTVTEGFPASLSVTVTSSAPLSYQWNKDGVKIPNATNSTFSLAAAALTDTGLYQVAVWNDPVPLTSQAVQLTVNIPTFGPPNRLVVQVASSFSNPIWTPVVTNTVLFSSVRRFYQMRASVLEVATDLKNPIWIPVATNNIGVTQPQKFYRLVAQ